MALPLTMTAAVPGSADTFETYPLAAQLSGIKDVIVSFLGAPNGSAVTAAAFALTTGGVVTVSQAGAQLGSAAPLTTPRVTTGIKDANGNEAIDFGATGSAVNHFKLTNAATGTDPVLEVVGDDAVVGLAIRGKGTGRVKVNGVLPGLFASGVVTFFADAGVPSGWTQTSDNDAVLRVVSGAGGGTGGTASISGGTATTATNANADGIDTSGGSTSPQLNHTHSVTWNIKFRNVTAATKD